MTKKHYLFRLPLFFFLAFLLSLTVLFFDQLSTFTFQSHSLTPKVLPLLIPSILFFFLLLGVWMGGSKAVASIREIGLAKAADLDLLTYFPLLFLSLLPCLLFFYLDANDLQTRFKIFLWSIFFSFLYLKTVALFSQTRDKTSLTNAIKEKLSDLSIKKKLLLLFATSLILYNTGSVLLTSSGQTFAGDEPHYLIITQSLLQDGDFDLSNNYADKDYRKTMLAQVNIKPHTAPGTKRKYSFHSPGTSFLLIPFYAVGSLSGGKFLVFFIRLGMSIFGALLGVQLFLYLLQEWKNETIALGVWFIYSFSSPVFFYSLHIYPEIIIALISLSVFRLLRFSPTFSRPTLLVLGLLLSCMVWFHAIKYLLILIPLFIYSIWTLLKNHSIGWRITYFLAFPFLLTLLYFLFQYSLYGSLSLSSVSWRGAMTSQESLSYIKFILEDIPYRIRWETLAGYFLDQKDGLLLYAPVYFFCFLGGVEMLRRNFRYFLLILFLGGPYILNSAFLTQRAGYAPQARPLVSISWILAILIGYFLAHNAKKIFSIFFSISVFLGFCSVILLLKNPLALYQITTTGSIERSGRLFVLLSNINFFLPKYLPSFLKINNSSWIPNYAWLSGLFLFIALYILVKRHDFRMRLPYHLIITSSGTLILFFWLALYPRTVLLHPTDISYPSGEKIRFYSLGRVVQLAKPGVFQLPRDNRSYAFLFTSWRKIEEFRMDFGSKEGVFDVKLSFFDQILYQGEMTHAVTTLYFSPPSSYRFKNANLYRLSIFLKRKSGVIAFSKPFLFSIQPLK
jgi:hypothetical protein